jgi:hypothetical protein
MKGRMGALDIKRKGQLIDTMERLHIYDLSRQKQQLNDTFTHLHNPVFDLWIKHAHHNNKEHPPSHHTSTLLTELHNPTPEHHVTRYCIPTKTIRLVSPGDRVRERYEENIQTTRGHITQGKGKVSNGAHLSQKLNYSNTWNINPSIKLIIIHFHAQHYLNHNNLVRKINDKIKKKLRNIIYTRWI